jgi:RNA polymerase sigma-B factor
VYCSRRSGLAEPEQKAVAAVAGARHWGGPPGKMNEPGSTSNSSSDPGRRRAATRGPTEQLADERELLRRYAADRSPAAREELVERFMPLARRLASRYAGGAESFEDLIQVASMALLKAVDRFDPGRETAFSTFAVPTIMGELKRHFRDRGWSVHVPRDVQERILKIERAQAELPAKLGHAPTVSEIAAALALDDEQVLEAMHAAQGHHAVSLDASSPLAEGEEPAPLGERIGEEDRGFEAVEYGATIAPTLKDVSERDRRVLHLRFVEDMTQSEIAEEVGVSQMHVSRILRTTLDRLREEIE